MPDTTPNPNPSNTPSEAPAAPAAAAPTPPRIVTGLVVVHNVSSKFYHVGTNDGEVVEYARYVDDERYALTLPVFMSKFHPASDQEKLMLEAMLPQFQTEGVLPDVRNVSLRYAAAQQGAQAAANPDESMVMLERRGNRETPDVGVLIETTDRDTFENLILHPTTVEEAKAGLVMLQQREALDTVFGISKIQPSAGKNAINFQGVPGTGKTRCAYVIARLLGKNLYQVDYAQMISKFVGDTAKHIAAAFAKATELDAVLFWDEADSLCSRRMDGDDSVGVSINQNRNVLMQELDRFAGVVVFSTNFIKNFDPAIIRRITRNVEFRLPTEAGRAKIYALHFPVMDKVRVTDGFARVARFSEGFSGGDILNVAINSMQRAALGGGDPSTWEITENTILREVVAMHRVKIANAKKTELEENGLTARLKRAENALNGVELTISDDSESNSRN